MNPAGPLPDLSRPQPPIRVLLVEDNPGDARLILTMLAEQGPGQFDCEQAQRLAAGLARLAQAPPALVLLDLSLPDSSGLASFQRLHQSFPAIPVIVLSGLNDEEVALAAVHEGAQDYLVKGQVDGPLLARAIRYALERQQIQEQLGRVAGELQEKNAQLQADLNMAREIQQLFIPQDYSTFPPDASPRLPSLHFEHLYLPASTVSGDFFSILPVSRTRAGLFLCDVMGHGLRAALVTALMRGLIEKLMPLAADPGRFLTELNRSLLSMLQRTDEPLLATAHYLLLDLESGVASFANAGHPSPLRVQRPHPRVQPLSHFDPRHGPALGLFPESSYPTCTCPAAPDDLFLLFTDGLYEIEDPQGHEFGPDRLQAALRQLAHLPLPALLESLVDEIRQAAPGNGFTDDVCVLAAELLPPQIQARQEGPGGIA